VDGHRHEVVSTDGTRIGLLTAGAGPSLLLVHGGMGCIESWQPLWNSLTSCWRVTAMDRRGRGSSGDTGPYQLSREFEDVTAAVASLAADGPVDVFGHSLGATCALGAAAGGAPLRRLALYEPPGPQAAPPAWQERVTTLVGAGKPGAAMMSFLTEIIGLTAEEIDGLRNAPRGYDIMPIVSATMPREARALAEVDLNALASDVTVPVLLILGAASPAWAGDITRELIAALPRSRVAMLPGQGHEAIGSAPEMLTGQLREFLAVPWESQGVTSGFAHDGIEPCDAGEAGEVRVGGDEG
jgi:pimeloyl-ACP methyl ester carboxylesterase